MSSEHGAVELRILLAGWGVSALTPVALRIYTVLRYRSRIVPPPVAPCTPIAIVFGAEVLPTGLPSAALHDRVATAVELYRLGKVRQLLLSGENRGPQYDEPGAMWRTAVALGVPADALALDGAGLRTHDTCYRAAAVYGVRRAALVTQRFHLPRALLLCEALGIEAVGVAAGRARFSRRHVVYWHAREVAATAVAWLDATVIRLRRRRTERAGQDAARSIAPLPWYQG